MLHIYLPITLIDAQLVVWTFGICVVFQGHIYYWIKYGNSMVK